METIMRKLFVLLFLCSSVFFAQSQILDTISLEKFKALKYKQLKLLYQNDEDGLELIKKSHTRKINSYVFFGLSVPFAVTLNPSIWMPLTPAVIKLSNNTKKNLYNKLRYYERMKYNLDTVVSKVPKDSNLNFYKYANTTFDINLEDFKKLSNKKIMEEYGFNDTSRWIIEYSKGKGFSKGIIIGTGALALFFGGSMYAAGISSINKYDAFPYQLSFLLGTSFVVSGIWLEIYGIKMKDAKTEIYTNLKQYYTTHNVSKTMAKYIQYKREQYKPKPFLN
jgi:hypothetical protein